MTRKSQRRSDPTLADRSVNAALRLVLALSARLPYRTRMAVMGFVAARIATPLAGWDRRIRSNLALIWPELPEQDVRRLIRQVPDNFGRAVAEIYAGAPFVERVRNAPLEGPGVGALMALHEANAPALLVTGHFGNYDALRAALIARGIRVGGLYNPMDNALVNDHYVAAIERIGKPLFARGRRGLAEMVQFLRSGGMVGLVADQHMKRGTALDFLGQPALTALSAAEMALKYEAALIPVYAVRQADRISFRLFVEAPIPASDAVTMTQALNDSLAARVRANPEQWLWIHRRWKGTADLRSPT
ncbi:MAG: lauroyl acyltransferase [Pseudomonadota bacterium]